ELLLVGRFHGGVEALPCEHAGDEAAGDEHPESDPDRWLQEKVSDEADELFHDVAPACCPSAAPAGALGASRARSGVRTAGRRKGSAETTPRSRRPRSRAPSRWAG